MYINNCYYYEVEEPFGCLHDLDLLWRQHILIGTTYRLTLGIDSDIVFHKYYLHRKQ